MLPGLCDSSESDLRATPFWSAKGDCGRQHLFVHGGTRRTATSFCPRRGAKNGETSFHGGTGRGGSIGAFGRGRLWWLGGQALGGSPNSWWRVRLGDWCGEGVGNMGIFASGGGICYPCTLGRTVGPHSAALWVHLGLCFSLDFVQFILAVRELAVLIVEE